MSLKNFNCNSWMFLSFLGLERGSSAGHVWLQGFQDHVWERGLQDVGEDGLEGGRGVGSWWTGHPAACEQVSTVNTLRPRQNGRHFPDDIFKCIFLNENVCITFKISLKFVPKGPIDKIPALVQIMAWRRTGDKPLSEPMMTYVVDAYMRHLISMN